MSYVLVVIDMQPYFSETAASILNNVCDVIKQAKEDDAFVLIVQYGGCGRSYNEIYDAVGHYTKWDIVTKEHDDGSLEIWDFFEADDISLESEIRICGVNYQYCVKATAIGLLEMMPYAQIKILRSACNGPLDYDRASDFHRATKYYERNNMLIESE